MKTYVLIISQTFPKKHLKSGKNTHFFDLIDSKSKIHTLRGNYELWKKRFKKIEENKAVLSLRFWSGIPYKSKQIEVKQLAAIDGVGLEKLEWDDSYGAFIENKHFSHAFIASNDGLNIDDYKDWIFAKARKEPLAVIHFTNFRYKNEN